MVALVLSLPSPLRAAEVEDAEARAATYYEIGSAAMRTKRYGKAVESFKRALQFDPNPVLLWNLARAHYLAGQLSEARKRFDEFRSDPQAPPNKREEAVAYIAEIDAKLAAEVVRENDERANTAQIAGWVVASTGAVALLSGLGIWVWAGDAADEQRRFAQPIAGMPEDLRLQNYDAATADKDARETAAGVLFVVGGIALVSGIVLVATSDRDERAEAPHGAVHLSPVWRRGGVEIHLGFSF